MTRKTTTPLIIGVFALAAVGAGALIWSAEDEPDTVGEAIEDAADDMGDAIDDAADDAKDAAEDLEDELDNPDGR